MFTFAVLPQSYSVVRLPACQELPKWAVQGELWSITRTADECSIICLESAVPEGTQSESGWRILKIEGPLDFNMVGVLSSISTLLSQADVSVFAISTYDTDYFLVKSGDLRKALQSLHSAGHHILG